MSSNRFVCVETSCRLTLSDLFVFAFQMRKLHVSTLRCMRNWQNDKLRRCVAVKCKRRKNRDVNRDSVRLSCFGAFSLFLLMLFNKSSENPMHNAVKSNIAHNSKIFEYIESAFGRDENTKVMKNQA